MQSPSIPRCDQGRAFSHCGKRAHQPPVQGNSQHRWWVERHGPGCAPAFQPHSEGHGREVREGPSGAGDGEPQAMCWRGWCSQLPRAHTRLALGWGALQHRWDSLSRAALWSDLSAFLCSCKFNSCGTNEFRNEMRYRVKLNLAIPRWTQLKTLFPSYASSRFHCLLSFSRVCASVWLLWVT